MTNLIQLIYISRSTFTPAKISNNIEPNVARILLKSRVNNKKNGLVGVLYFGDGCFFQCLEGVAEAVDQLYETLLKDTRHKDLKVISRKSIDTLTFSNWSMKHVPLEDEMNKLLKSQGFKTFNPYKFSAEMTQNALNLFLTTNDDTDSFLLEDVNLQASKLDNQVKQAHASQINNKNLIIYALITIVLLAVLVVFLK